MSKTDVTYREFVREALGRTPLASLLQSRSAVVLERIARGAGMTKWYYCRDLSQLGVVIDSLRPGSQVSFYFDGHIRKAPPSDALAERLSALVRDSEGFIAGCLDANGVDINMKDCDPDDIADLMRDRSNAAIFHGEYPAADNDGVDAITVTLPDADGAVRGHPH